VPTESIPTPTGFANVESAHCRSNSIHRVDVGFAVLVIVGVSVKVDVIDQVALGVQVGVWVGV
jgi:hypothetical protein